MGHIGNVRADVFESLVHSGSTAWGQVAAAVHVYGTYMDNKKASAERTMKPRIK
jgi:hypothetical protein